MAVGMSEVHSACNHTNDKQNRMAAKRSPIC